MMFVWALATILTLSVLWLLRRHESALPEFANPRRIYLGLVFLAAGSFLKFIQSYPLIRPALRAEAGIILDLFSGIALLTGGFLSAVFLCRLLPGLRSILFPQSVSGRMARLVARVTALPAKDNCATFIDQIGRTIAVEFMPDHYALARLDAGRFAIEEQRFRLICTAREIAYRQEENGHGRFSESGTTTKGCDLAFNFTDGIKAHYRLSLTNDDGSRIACLPAERTLLEEVVNSRLRAITRIDRLAAKCECDERQLALFDLAGKTGDIASYLEQAHAILNQSIKCDYVSIAVLDKAIQNMYRHTYIATGRRFVERGICYPLKQTIVSRVAHERRMLLANMLEADYYRDDYHLYKSGFSSRLAYPLENSAGEILGVLTLAAVKPRAFNHLGAEDLRFLNNPLCRLIEFHSAAGLMQTLKKQINSSFDLTMRLEESGIREDFFEQSARILSESLPATLCRIWSLDRANNRLELLGSHSLHTCAGEPVGQDQDLDLSLMPRHKAAIDLGKPLIINQTNPETVMDGPEREALGLPSLQSAILAPMRLEQRVMGILSIGEMRNWERRTLGPQELLYAQIVSTLDALVYELAERGRQLRMERERFEQYESKAQLYHTYADLPRRLSSPISAILGAAEIIEGGSPNPPSELAKYNGIILKSVRAMMTEIRRFDELKNVLARNLV